MNRVVIMLAVLGSTLAAQTSAEETGTISGRLMYPSDYIPEDMIVCAEHAASGETFCTDEHLERGGDTTYRLSVPAGGYTVYAKLTAPESYGAAYGPDYRAYYSEFVTCGLMASCASHKPIVVEVKAGQAAADIDPADWYDNQ